jgi:hypothetical protein
MLIVTESERYLKELDVSQVEAFDTSTGINYVFNISRNAARVFVFHITDADSEGVPLKYIGMQALDFTRQFAAQFSAKSASASKFARALDKMLDTLEDNDALGDTPAAGTIRAEHGSVDEFMAAKGLLKE